MYVYPFNEHTQLTSPTVLSIHKFIESAISARQVEGVEAAVQEALKLEPENARTHLLAGYMYEEKRQLGPAELEFRKSISEFPNSLPALGSLGELLLAKKDTAGAIEFLSKANAQDTSDMRTRTILQRLKARK
jgi:Flp pilus assembly protein TadD